MLPLTMPMFLGPSDSDIKNHGWLGAFTSENPKWPHLPDAPKMESNVGKVMAGIYQGALKPTADFMASPAGIATLGLGAIASVAQKVVGIAMAPLAMVGAANEIQSVDVNKDDAQETIRKLSSAFAQALGGFGAFKAGGGAAKYTGGHGEDAMVALHASPHDFDAFDLSHLGTGEGAQAFGHGIYAAERPEINQYYYNKFAQDAFVDDSLDNVTIGGLAFAYDNPEHQAAYTLHFHKGDKAKTIQTLSRGLQRYSKEVLADLAELEQTDPVAAATVRAIHLVTEGADKLPKVEEITPPAVGMNYKVDLPFEKEDLLDWHKPFSKQEPKIKKALESMGIDQEFLKTDPKGADIYTRLGQMHGNRIDETEGWSSINHTLWRGDERIGDEAKASKALLANGIPGIKYYDSISRGESTGTHNVVAFDDKGIKILQKKRGLFDQ